MSYHHKSGAQKRREKAMRTESKGPVLNEEDLLEIEEEPEEVPRSEPCCWMQWMDRKTGDS